MLERIAVIISSAIMILSELTIIKKSLNIKKPKKNVYTIFLFIVLVLIATLSFHKEYKLTGTVIMILSVMLISKAIYKKSIFKIILASVLGFILIAFVDLINATVLMFFFTAEEIRDCWYVLLLSNFNVAIVVYFINKTSLFSRHVKRLLNRFEKKYLLSLVTFAILTLIIISILFYNVSIIYGWNSNYIINLSIMLIFFFLSVLFFIEKNNYNNLLSKYDILFDYVQGFEDKIEQEQLNLHEYKNQLAVLRSLVNNKKVLKVLDEMIQLYKIDESEWIDQLKPLPKGGIKGLIYYKVIICSNKKINFIIDVNSDVTEYLTKLTEEQRKILIKLIGIYFDNAIEAAEKTKKKMLTLEIYMINDYLNFVFTNSFKKKEKLIIANQRRGVSTKGAGRGNGIYFANKLIKKNEWLSQERIIVNDFYVQKLKISIKK